MLTPPHNPESSGRNGNKRKSSLAAAPGPIPAYAALVLDIEGTLCPISFVHETLFPFVKERLRKYIEKHWSEPAFAAHIDALRRQAEEDSTSGDAKLEAAPRIPEGTGDDTKDAVEANVRWQMSWDRKGGALKSLQGEMWREGYQDGDIKGLWALRRESGPLDAV